MQGKGVCSPQLYVHRFDALSQWLDDLYTKLFGAGHDPKVNRDSSVVEDIIHIRGAVGGQRTRGYIVLDLRWRWIEYEL